MQWAIVNGEKKVGLTVHYVNKKIDSGPIIAKEFLEIKNLDTSDTLKQKIQLLIFSIIRTKLYSFRYNKFYSLKQDLKKRIVWRKRTKSDSQIIWSKHSDFEISCLTRAMTYPLPKPYYFDISGKKIVVESTMTPAQVKQFEKDFLIYEYFDHRWCRFIGYESIKFPFKKKLIFLLLIILPREIEKLSNLSQIILL